MKRVKFYTLGCKVNQYDTQSIRESFIQAGFKEPEDGEPADMYVINTCTVTHRADSESLGLIHKARRQNPKARIIVTGCLAELDKDLIKSLAEKNLIIKNKDQMLGERRGKGNSGFKGHTRAFLKIQDGCNNNCSYCKVPLVRGTSKSKPLSLIIEEAGNLVNNGFKEIVLTGICLGAYGRDLRNKISMVDVIRELENIEGLLRIRLSSIEAGDVSDELICRIAQSKKICRHLHIPIQSGDDEILKMMNRRYTFKSYLNLIKRLRSSIPQIAITTDCLVGFPGERKENFRNTIKLIKEVNPLRVHIFPYSPRRGTAAFNFKKTLHPDIIKERISCLKGISEKCALAYKKQFLDSRMDVLIEAKEKPGKEHWEGYTGNYIRVRVKSRLKLKNKLIPLKLKKIDNDIILADLV